MLEKHLQTTLHKDNKETYDPNVMEKPVVEKKMIRTLFVSFLLTHDIPMNKVESILEDGIFTELVNLAAKHKISLSKTTLRRETTKVNNWLNEMLTDSVDKKYMTVGTDEYVDSH